MVVTLYPGRKATDLPTAFPADDSTEELDRITSYFDDDKTPPHSVRQRVDEDLLREFNQNISKLEKMCDNFALYPPGERDWFACTIPHEGMALVKDDGFLAQLKEAGLNATDEKPEWW